MTLAARRRRRGKGSGIGRLLRGEDVLEAAAVGLEPHQAQAEVGRDVADQVVHGRRRAPAAASMATWPPRGPTVTPARGRGPRPCRSPRRRRRPPRPAGCRSARGSRRCASRSRRPPSSTMTWSLTRSSSPSRWEVTRTAMPKSLADALAPGRACRCGRRGRGRWSARRGTPAAGRGRAPGRAWPAASCRWSSRPSAGSAPRRGPRGAARRPRARGPPRRRGRTSGPCGPRSHWR